MNYFVDIQKWTMPAKAFRFSMDEMALDGRLGNEGVAFWLGVHQDEDAIISHVVVVRGDGIIKAPQLLMIDDAVMNAITDVCIARGLILIGQIHSHGPGNWVELSRTDKTEGFRSPSYLSAVAPYYAQDRRTRFQDCGLHVCDNDSRFRRLSQAEIETRIILSDSADAELLTVELK